MPNHIHLIWKLNKLNGKETPKGSFLKFTAHKLLDQLQQKGKLDEYLVFHANKKHEIWQRDSLGIEIISLPVSLNNLNKNQDVICYFQNIVPVFLRNREYYFPIFYLLF